MGSYNNKADITAFSGNTSTQSVEYWKTGKLLSPTRLPLYQNAVKAVRCPIVLLTLPSTASYTLLSYTLYPIHTN